MEHREVTQYNRLLTESTLERSRKLRVSKLLNIAEKHSKKNPHAALGIVNKFNAEEHTVLESNKDLLLQYNEVIKESINSLNRSGSKEDVELIAKSKFKNSHLIQKRNG